MSDEVEDIKQRLDLVDFISGYLTLKKSGQNYKALCPFHQEKTPSFMVSKDKQIWKCFGCNLGGDIFDFVMQMENLDFGDAIRTLAEKAGVKVRPRRVEDYLAPSIKTTLYKVNLLAGKVYQEVLLSEKVGKGALEYLKTRKLSPKTINDFQLGFAPESFDFLLNFLKSKGFSESDVEQAGLLVRRQSGGFYDRFRGRIMFPIFDVMGNVVGFSGRILEDKEDKKDIPKYINSSDSPIFHKSKILYGLDRAKVQIKKYQFAVLVEGQMDVILSHQAGVKVAVATSGTAVTEEHLRILSRYAPKVIFAFDTDSAGILSTKKAIDLALPLGLTVKIASVLPYKDPGEAASDNPPKYSEALSKAKMAVDWHFDLVFQKFSDESHLSVASKKEIAKELLPLISKISDEIERAHYIQLLSQKLSVSQETIVLALERTKEKISPPQSPKQFRPPSPSHSPTHLHLLGLLILYPQTVSLSLKRLTLEDFKTEEDVVIYRQILKWYNLGSRKQNKEDIVLFLKKNLPLAIAKKVDLLLWETKIQHQDQSLEQIAAEIYQAITSISKAKIKSQSEELVSQIKEAEEKGQREKVKKLLLRLQNVSQK